MERDTLNWSATLPISPALAIDYILRLRFDQSQFAASIRELEGVISHFPVR